MKIQLHFVSTLFLVTDPEPHYFKNKKQFCDPPPSISPPRLHNIRINLFFLARESDIRILWKCFIQVLIILGGGGGGRSSNLFHNLIKTGFSSGSD